MFERANIKSFVLLRKPAHNSQEQLKIVDATTLTTWCRRGVYIRIRKSFLEFDNSEQSKTMLRLRVSILKELE